MDLLSSNSQHIEVIGNGHEIHLLQPERVLDGISRAVLAVRHARPLVDR